MNNYNGDRKEQGQDLFNTCVCTHMHMSVRFGVRTTAAPHNSEVNGLLRGGCAGVRGGRGGARGRGGVQA